VERWLADHEIDSLLDGRHSVDEGNEQVASVLAHLRDAFRRPVSCEVAHRHLEAMLAAAPPAPVARAPRVRPRRLLALVACMGMTFAYGGLSAAGALPTAVDVPHHVHEWFGGAAHHERVPAPTMGAVVVRTARVGPLEPPAGGHGTSAADEPHGDGAPQVRPPSALTSRPVVSTPSATAPGHAPAPGTEGAPANGNGADHANDHADNNANDHSNVAPDPTLAPPGRSGATPANGAAPADLGRAPGAPATTAPGSSSEHANTPADAAGVTQHGGQDAH
jgi:hypothetical protein